MLILLSPQGVGAGLEAAVSGLSRYRLLDGSHKSG